MSAVLGKPWMIYGDFYADVSVDIVTDGGWSFCEVTPFCGEWTDDEIKRVQAVRAAPEMLDSLIAIRKLGYDTPGELESLRKAMAKITRIAEAAILAAESTSTRDSAGDPAGGAKDQRIAERKEGER